MPHNSQTMWALFMAKMLHLKELRSGVLGLKLVISTMKLKNAQIRFTTVNESLGFLKSLTETKADSRFESQDLLHFMLAVRKEFRRTRLETKERVVGAECGIDAELLQGLYINTCRVAVLTPRLTSPTPPPLYVRTKTLSIFPLNRP
ncbi:hypothetical protein CDAR_93781 [Caerostris darwini]|uniref:Uncharacterized protein n=1 Tax=Caerostris darwini TaxID=1538125 RepID=A0AAV4NJU8_9ARAC|nr:hypothetical protein CDAR_93781 [Caerostris darwini]